VEETVALMRAAENDPDGIRLRGVIRKWHREPAKLAVTYKTAWRIANLIRNQLMTQDDEPIRRG
jgi:hypothetical protein